MVGKNIAAIDLGTNSCRLTIANTEGKLLYRDSMATKLGEGLHQNMRFTPQAIERGIKAFEKYAQIMKNFQVSSYRAIATASCRMATNSAEFIAQVKKSSGINIEVIDGVEEARLNLKGALLNAPKNAKYAVVYDLGGGSTEITLATNESHPQIIHTVSIPWGGRNAAEAFSLVNYTTENHKKLENEIARHVRDFCQQTNLDKYREDCCLIATSSTPLRLASMVQGCGCYERDKSDGAFLSVEDTDKVVAKIYTMDLEARKNSPYIGENRAPIFISACTIFKTIYTELGFKHYTASLKSAQDGMIKELINYGKIDAVCQKNTRS